MPMLFWSFGASAEYAAIPISLIAPKPKNISFVQAAAIPLVGTTVVTGFNSVLETMNQTSLENCKVLIQAGGGGVGSFAIQYAKNGKIIIRIIINYCLLLFIIFYLFNYLSIKYNKI